MGSSLEDLDLALDVGSLLAGVVAHAELVADREGGDLGSEVFFGVPDAAETIDQVPVPSGVVATPPMPVTGSNCTESPASAVRVSASCPVDLRADTPLAVRYRRTPAADPPLYDRELRGLNGRLRWRVRDHPGMEKASCDKPPLSLIA